MRARRRLDQLASRGRCIEAARRTMGVSRQSCAKRVRRSSCVEGGTRPWAAAKRPHAEMQTNQSPGQALQQRHKVLEQVVGAELLADC